MIVCMYVELSMITCSWMTEVKSVIEASDASYARMYSLDSSHATPYVCSVQEHGASTLISIRINPPSHN